MTLVVHLLKLEYHIEDLLLYDIMARYQILQNTFSVFNPFILSLDVMDRECTLGSI